LIHNLPLRDVYVLTLVYLIDAVFLNCECVDNYLFAFRGELHPLCRVHSRFILADNYYCNKYKLCRYCATFICPELYWAEFI